MLILYGWFALYILPKDLGHERGGEGSKAEAVRLGESQENPSERRRLPRPNHPAAQDREFIMHASALKT